MTFRGLHRVAEDAMSSVRQMMQATGGRPSPGPFDSRPGHRTDHRSPRLPPYAAADRCGRRQAMSHAMLICMGRTTLSTTTQVRDRLAAVAKSRRTTVTQLLEVIASRLEREEAMRRATESYRRLAERDPAGFEEYLAEGRAWEAATVGDGLGSARDEFPEFNR